jgi:hypothetical protein
MTDKTPTLNLAAEIAALHQSQPQVREAGLAALRRLLPTAQGKTEQGGVVASFLLGLYDGGRFPFDMTNFRRLDYRVLQDCMAVLQMDHSPTHPIHAYFPNGTKIWEQLVVAWGVKDRLEKG